MATLKASIQIYKNMTSSLRKTDTAIRSVAGNSAALQTALSRTADITKINTINIELAGTDKRIESAVSNQANFNQAIDSGKSTAEGLFSKIKKTAAGVKELAGTAEKVMDIADRNIQIKARLEMINDGEQSADELQKMIYRSAQRSGSDYMASADTVGQIGINGADAFGSNKEMIAFVEQANKHFALAGTSAAGQSAAMQRLTQAMGAGVMRSEELNSVFEQAPTLINAISSYLGKPITDVRKLAADGKLTADVVKAALFSAAEETNQKFQQMPRTFEQIGNAIKNRALMAFQPVLEKISQFAESPAFETFAGQAVNLIVKLADAALKAVTVLSGIGNFIAKNWAGIGPIVYGVVTVFLAYNAVAAITNGLLAVQALRAKTAAAAQMLMKSGAWLATVAQQGLNAALLACPLTWIVLAIMAVIAVIALVVQAINHFAGTSLTATGVIMGAFASAGAFLYNLFLGVFDFIIGIVGNVVNRFADAANFIANVFKNPISSVIYLFQGMADNVLGIIGKIASAIDFVFGSNLSGIVSGWRDGLKEKADSMVEKYAPEENYRQVIEKKDWGVGDLGLERIKYGDAWKAGNEFGDKIQNSFSLGSSTQDADFNNTSDALMGYGLENELNGIYNNTWDTAGSTGNMAESMTMGEEDLRYLRDIAEREAINRFTTAEVRVEQVNNNHISSDMDLDGIISHLNQGIQESINIAAEGVHE